MARSKNYKCTFCGAPLSQLRRYVKMPKRNDKTPQWAITRGGYDTIKCLDCGHECRTTNAAKFRAVHPLHQVRRNVKPGGGSMYDRRTGKKLKQE